MRRGSSFVVVFDYSSKVTIEIHSEVKQHRRQSETERAGQYSPPSPPSVDSRQ